jgi:hypothetical protein
MWGASSGGSAGQQEQSDVVGYKSTDLPLKFVQQPPTPPPPAGPAMPAGSAAAEQHADVAAAEDTGRKPAAIDSSNASGNHELQDKQLRVRFGQSIRSIKAFGSKMSSKLFRDYVADAASPFERHGAAYGDLLQVHQCSFGEEQQAARPKLVCIVQ